MGTRTSPERRRPLGRSSSLHPGLRDYRRREAFIDPSAVGVEAVIPRAFAVGTRIR